MTEADFLQNYDPEAFARLAVTVDLVLLAVDEGRLVALLQKRDAHPDQGKYALPGGFVGEEEGLDEAARRVLESKAKLGRVWLEQLYTFGEPKRDPRMRIVTVAYFALMPVKRLQEAADRDPNLILAALELDEVAAANKAELSALSPDGQPVQLAFDHANILKQSLIRLRGKLDYAPIAFPLLPARFTLRELQEVHEAILGRSLTKPAFRRRMLDQGWIEATGEFETGSAYRPAELYEFNASKGDTSWL